MKKPKPNKSPTMAESAYSQLEDLIVTQQLPPGSMISEIALAQQLGCGRTPIREALQRLRHEGFIEVLPRRGALVSTFDVVRQMELIEFRRPVEVMLSELAAARAERQERDQMTRLGRELVRMAELNNIQTYISINKQEHELRARSCRNVFLEKCMMTVFAQSRRFWFGYIIDRNAFISTANMQKDILDAIASGNDSRARSVTEDFLEHLTSLSVEVLRRHKII